MLFRKTSIALAAMAACGAAQAAPTNLAFKQPANNQVITSSIFQSPACELTGNGIARVDFYLGSTRLNSEGSAPWNCNLDPRQFKDGSYVLRAVAFDSSNTSASAQINVTLQTGNIDTSGGSTGGTTTPTGGSTSYAGTPYGGTPIALPKAFAAADFDRGGQGVAYSDRTTGNAGGQYRTSEDVDIVAQADSISPYAVNSLQTGEWLAYTVNVPSSGKYDLAINAAHNYSGTPAFRLEIDGADVTGRISVPKTGSWSTFQWVGRQGVDLAAGKRVIKVVSEAEYFNLKGISVLAAAGTTPTTPPATSGPVVSFKAPLAGATVSKTLSASACEALVSNGTTAIRQVQFFVDGAALNTEGSAPWNCSFDTTKVADGTRNLRAVATDVNGKTGAAEISVLVSNGGGTTTGNGPTNVAFVAPRNGATISGTLESSACELTGTGIARVDFSIDGKALNTEGSAPWNCKLPTTQYGDGAHKLKAVAYNSSGQTTVAEIDVTINNGGGSTGSTGGTTQPAGGELKFSCSFENSPTDCGFSEQAKVKPRATLVSTARDGAKAVRLHTEPGDNNVSGSGEWERNDLGLTQALSDCYEGRSGWWAHSIYFPSDYTLPAWGGVVMDFHHTGSGGQANFHIDAMKDGGLRFRGNGGSATNPTTYQVWLGPAVKNVWYDFVYQVKWSSKSDGFMRAWVNGVKKLDYSGPTLYAGMGCYLKLANYHDASGSPSSVIHDRVRYGTTAAAVTSTPLQGLQ